ncbi:MAG TPA: gamma-glutamyltransferase [Burkholderiales bacterium]|nr:gamma-glutamyltransferase [Burkholderiales bacterium]
MQPRWRAIISVALVVVSATAASMERQQQSAAIASAHPLATDAGRAVLDRGGNAFDAAVATAAALAVVEPYSSGLGGGGFFLLHRAADAHQVMVDARETAPAAVSEGLYLDGEGRPLRNATTVGGKAAAIPGLPAGLVHVATRYGSLPLTVLLAPAIRLAREGFPVDARYARIAKLREAYLRAGVNTTVFLDSGNAPAPGFILRQPELAATFERIARDGAEAFYRGPVAESLVETVNGAGGVWRAADLEGYRVLEREPIRFEYRGARITSAALPSAGGIALAQALGMLERFAIETPRSAHSAHLVIEALRRVFHDRARYLADPGFVRVPVTTLLSREYSARRASEIDRARASVSDTLADAPRAESHNTTHLSVVDSAGNRVAATLTINLLFGSGLVAPGTGVLINNEMDDFSLRDDVPNAFRLRGGAANRIEPGKRPLSSMTPTFVEDERGVLILGSPGGSRIVSQVLLAVLDYVHTPVVDLERIVAAPRYHHQFWPDRVEIEPQGFAAEWRADLSGRGHRIQSAARAWGNMQAVYKAHRSGVAQAASDPRGKGVAWY